ncbi:MAG: hypothetical protein KAI17_27990, partial [Thiotrichaceae bacterium]|nr:hypothetical protein [Thiotrichaceae bacterium]
MNNYAAVKSIQSKLSIGLFVSLLSIFFILWLVLSYSIQHYTDNYTVSRLEHDVETLLSAIEFDQNNHLLLNQQRINAIYKRPFSGHYYTIGYQQKL